MQNFNDIIGCHAPFTKPCPDRLFGKIRNGKYIPFKSQDRKYIYYRNERATYINLSGKEEAIPNQVVVAILESPHTSEYAKNGNPLGVANGRTGEMFNSNFVKHFRQSKIAKLITKGEFSVVLINAVQFQCSLGKQLNYCGKGKDDSCKAARKECRKNKRGRDANWLRCINNKDCCDDFLMRLRALNPKVVLNLCTIGYSNLQLVLCKIIENKFASNMAYTCGSHPSTWNFPSAQIQ